MDISHINILSNRYESVLSAQMTKSLGKCVIICIQTLLVVC